MSNHPITHVPPGRLPTMALTIALWEAQQDGILTQEQVLAIANRSDDLLGLLNLGYELAPNGNRYEPMTDHPTIVTIGVDQ